MFNINDKLLLLLIGLFLTISIYAIYIIFKHAYFLFGLKTSHDQMLEYINSKIKNNEKIARITAENSMLFEYYDSSIDIYSNHFEPNVEHKTKLLIDEVKIKWQHYLYRNIEILKSLEIIIVFIGWLATFYYILITNSQTINALLPLSLSGIILFISTIAKQVFESVIKEQYNSLDKFSIILNQYIKKITKSIKN